jgi:hypothetical protein
MRNIITTFENFKNRLYVTCKNAPEDNYDLHNLKDYEVVKYDDQPYGIGLVTILLPNGNERTYPKIMFSEPFEKGETNKLIKSARVMAPQEIEDQIALQNRNQENLKDVFDLMDKIMTYNFTNQSEKNGSIKTIQMIRSHLLNREIK